jgi:hypothetical protein
MRAGEGMGVRVRVGVDQAVRVETLFCFTPSRQVAKRLRRTGVVCVLLVVLALRAQWGCRER